MIKSYIKIAWRNLRRNKAYAFINITGLSLGIASSILIFILIDYHLSFDDFHKNSDRIYRVVTEWHDETIDRSAAVPQPLGKALRNDFTFGEKVARSVSFHNPLITLPNEKEIKKFAEKDGVAFTEPEFFDIFNFPLIKGNKKTVLVQLNEAIVTQKIAQKYWGTDDVIGKVIRLDNRISFTITGVLKDLPPNTDQKQQIYLSYKNIIEYASQQRENNWGGVNSESKCYLLLKPSVPVSVANANFKQMVNKYYTGRDQKVWMFKLQPLADIHFNTDFDAFVDKKYLWALFFIGVFLIVTACVNFINLATAQALNRAKEIGVRKVLGSMPRQLFWQFIAETTIITLVADALAYVIAWLVLPLINQLFQSQMQFNNELLPLFLVVMTVIVVFLSGSYPGVILARFQPIEALKSKLSQKNIGGFSLRRILVVTQFAISQVLIIGTIVIVSQIHYSKTSDLGFDKQAIITLPIPNDDNGKMKTLHNRLGQLNGVKDISLCYQPPAANSNSTTDIYFNNRPEAEHWGINIKAGDDHYLSTFDIKLVAGRNILPADTTSEFLVNETFVKKLGLKSPDEVIGKKLSVNGKTISGLIVGVVKDFYNYSFHSEISPICIMPNTNYYSNYALKLSGSNFKASLTNAEKLWNETYPDELYDYKFLDDQIAEFYEMDDVLMKLVEGFAAIAIIIGCLGLYGLVSFMALRKTKEIGVRKVLGADVGNILWLFGKEFSRLLIIAFVIAAPVAWWAMTNYLKDYQYKITIGPSIFILSILSTFIIAAVTVGYRSMLSARANPVKSLRSE
ncbi:ABC transporter permease [Mucilaginibacter segetis]|uniref:ABC transporter permease n=1 Tax=Mucilaginibacter segetis TaxID=2793071 RepID=A0A934UPN2_9SPHI|nr:ABC transporter permease [Mucilaginibacter segetis]MBK0381066.1 ABC transporter permease [Mucilaginibacter segetis]